MAITEHMNAAMRPHASQAHAASPLDPALQTILDAGFIDCDGSVFLTHAADSVHGSDRLDRTGHEALANHIHVEDHLAQPIGPAAIDQAVHYTRALATGLLSAFPAYSSDVVLAVGDAATVRFYRRRPNESPWLASDLEGYKREAVLLLTVNQPLVA